MRQLHAVPPEVFDGNRLRDRSQVRHGPVEMNLPAPASNSHAEYMLARAHRTDKHPGFGLVVFYEVGKAVSAEGAPARRTVDCLEDTGFPRSVLAPQKDPVPIGAGDTQRSVATKVFQLDHMQPAHGAGCPLTPFGDRPSPCDRPNITLA